MREGGPTFVEQVLSSLVRNYYQIDFNKDLISMWLNASTAITFHRLTLVANAPVTIYGSSYHYVQ